MRYIVALLLVILLPIYLSEVSGFIPDPQPYTEDDLPKLFDIENYQECSENAATYCKVNIVIKPCDPNSKLVNIIERSKKYDNRFDRQYIHRLICFKNDTFGDYQRMADYSLQVVQREVLEYQNLSTKDVELAVRDFHCSGQYPFELGDLLFWITVLFYVFLIYKSTTYDLKKRNNPEYPYSKYEKLYDIFSIRRNWEQVMRKSERQDFQRLRCVQVLRFYVTTMMIINHTKLSYGILYFGNSIDFEKICGEPIFYLQIVFDMLFIIQTYFMLSSFLMTNQVLEVKKKHGYLSLYHCCVLCTNRICRFLPSVLVMVLITMYGSKIFTAGPHVNEFIYAIQTRCRTAWWTPILQIGFLKKFEEMCVPGSWYTSVDTLFYVTGMLILYFHFKTNVSLNKILAVILVLTSTIYAITIYAHDFPVVFRVNANVFANLYDSPEFNKLYISPFSSYSTMCVGVFFGSLYFNTKNQPHWLNGVKHTLFVTFLITGLPLIVYMSEYDYEGIVRSIVAPIIKPTVATCSAILIIILSRRQGGIFNKLFEWEFAFKMGNFTFSTYIFHFFLVFQRGAFDTELFIFKRENLVIVIIFNVVASYLLGIFCCLIIEQPFARLQKMYLPQIKDLPTNQHVTSAEQQNRVNELEKKTKIN